MTNHTATKLVYSAGDCHIYEDQLPFLQEQLARVPRAIMPRVTFNPDVKEIDDFKVDDILVSGYERQDVHPNIAYPVAV